MGNGEGASPVLDRSNVRILLCDKDPTNSSQVQDLLRKCSYQVIAVATARDVIGVLNTESQMVDLILADVDLPMAKGFKMLKYITREKHLQRIPIVMMSAQDEVTVVMKCLKLGAADYLVKPLRVNELLNLWIHMWRRRRMLGLSEKNIIGKSLIHDLDLLVSDPSESNTNSTTLFSDDTDDKKVRSHTGPEISTLATPPEFESKDYPGLELSLKHPSDVTSEVRDTSPLKGKFSCPKKSELKVGESSAFLTYVKNSNQANKKLKIDEANENNPFLKQQICIPQKQNAAFSLPTDVSAKVVSHNSAMPAPTICRDIVCDGNRREMLENRSNNSGKAPNMCNDQMINPTSEQFPTLETGVNQDGHNININGSGSGAGSSSLNPSSHFVQPRILNHSLMPSSMQLCHGMVHHEVAPPHVLPGMIPFHALQPCQGVPVNAAISYYPFGLHVAPGQLGPASHGWAPMANMSISAEPKLSQTERREAALNKFRQKRKDRCFDKKIRYVSRKKLAEQRPRIRGQFVRQTNDADAGSNVLAEAVDDSEEDDDVSSEAGQDSSSESLAKGLDGFRYQR